MKSAPAPPLRAVLRLELLAPLAHVGRGERRVLLRGEVEVEGDGDLRAALRALRDRRREHAAAAAVVEREGEVGRAEDRRAEEPQARAVRGALVVPVVEVELGRLQAPVVAAGLAGREERIAQAVVLAAQELDAPGAAARRELPPDQELGLLERSGVRRRVVVQARPGKVARR